MPVQIQVPKKIDEYITIEIRLVFLKSLQSQISFHIIKLHFQSFAHTLYLGIDET